MLTSDGQTDKPTYEMLMKCLWKQVNQNVDLRWTDRQTYLRNAYKNRLTKMLTWDGQTDKPAYEMPMKTG